jgi:glucose 1-dehydrogenase
MLIRTIAVELAPHQITVNNIGPGAIYTPIDKDVEIEPSSTINSWPKFRLGDGVSLRR